LHVTRKSLRAIWLLNGQLRHSFVLGVDRQRGKILILCGQGDLSGPDLHGRLGGIFTTGEGEQNTGGNKKTKP